MSTTVSNYQLPLLRHCIRHTNYMSIEEAMEFDQRGFRSFLIRKWLAYRPGYGFHLTPDGKKAWELLHYTEIRRQDATRPLTRYFDYVAYGLQDPRHPHKPKVRAIRKGAAA